MRPTTLANTVRHLAFVVLLGIQPSYTQAAETHPIAKALDRALQDGWTDLRFDVGCLTQSGYRAVEIFGNGIGIWNHQRQFPLTEDELHAWLQIFKEVDFAAFQEVYGAKKATTDPKNLPPKVTCSVTLHIDGIAKESRQLYEGDQFEALRYLAERILELSRTRGESGVAAHNLDDGLSKIENQVLAPETLRIVVHRRMTSDLSGREETGWLLKIQGRRASTQLLTRTEGYRAPLWLELDQQEIAVLVNAIREYGIDKMPRNLYAQHYTDVTVEVLDHEKRIQARQFGRMNPTTHGELQAQFDKVFDELQKLHSRVVERGN